jgi:hypothetical protein
MSEDARRSRYRQGAVTLALTTVSFKPQVLS